MQVIGHSDHDTHSIMGGGKRHAATVNLNSGLITTLSTSLYSDNFLATVRETICNGWDAHKVSNRTHIPLEIELSSTSLVIRDFGYGIPHDKIGQIYLDYGGSTKIYSDVETGGFGLGSKSPFSYTDFFNVENNNGGTKGVYTVSRGSSETDGMPDMITMVLVPTTDEGLTVEIPIADPKDVPKFMKVIVGVISLGGINAKVNGELIDCIDMEGTKEGILFTSRKPYINNGVLYVRYGNVIYPIKEHRDYADLYTEATKLMRQTEKRRKNRSWGWDDHESLIAIIDCAPNSLSVVPSREDLHSSARTVATIKAHLERFVKLFNPHEGSEYILKKEREIIAEAVQKGEDLRPFLLGNNIIMTHYQNNDDRFHSMEGDFQSVDELIVALAANGHFYDLRTLQKARAYRLEAAKTHTTVDKDLVYNLAKILKTRPKLWDDGYYAGYGVKYKPLMAQINPILRRAAGARLQSKNFIYWDTTQMAGRKLYSGWPLYQTEDNFAHLVRMTKREVMLVPHKAAIKRWKHERPKAPDFANEIPDKGCLVYVMPGTKKYASYEETLAFFKRMGYKVWDIVKFINDNAIPKPVKPPKPKRTTAPKPKGHYLSIENLIDEYKQFSFRRHLDIDPKDLKYVANPVAILQGSSLPKNSYSPRFFVFGDRYASTVMSLIGGQFAIAKTVVEYERAIKDGAIPGLDYIIDKVCEAVKNDMGYKHNRQIRDVFKGYDWLGERLYQRLKKTKTCAHLPDLPEEKPYDKKVMELFDHLYGQMYRSHFTDDHRTKLEEAFEFVAKWDENPIDSPFKGFFPEGVSDRLRNINLTHILVVLEDSRTSIEERVRCEALLSITLFG